MRSWVISPKGFDEGHWIETFGGRVVGIGVAAPYGIGDWPQELGGAPEVLGKWKGIDIRRHIAASQQLPVWFEHEATAACLADLVLHDDGSRFDNYLYIFIGTIIGGGVVLDGALYRGPFDYAGAVGPMPIPSSSHHLRPGT